MNRREFLQAVGTTAAGAALASDRLLAARGSESGEPFHLNYLLASPLYGTLPLAELLPEVEKAGAAALDIWPRPHADHREQVEALGHARFLQLLAEQGVRLEMITRFDLGPFGLRDELPILKSFGGTILVTGAGRGQGDSVPQRVKSFVEALKPHVDQAAELGLTIAIENHANSLVDSADSIRYFADFAPAAHLGVALAPYHLPQDEALLASLIEGLGPRLAHFYAWQHGAGCMTAQPKEQELLQLPGRGPLDFQPLLAALKKIAYTGWTEIFMHPFPRGIPILGTTAEVTAAINASRDYLARCLRRA
jgi:sugar phosphate isomerase/epimerase